MPLYQVANLLIDSAVALPGVPGGRPGPGAWRFAVRRGARRRRPLAWYHHEESPDGRLQRSLARDGDCDVVRFARRASFTVSFGRREIVCHPHAGTTIDGVRQLFLGHVLPLVFADRGALALHASAVRAAGGVLTFVGDTGGGKSTIAAALAARGCPLVADDCAIVEVVDGECRVRPMHIGVRLWPDALRMLAPRRRTVVRRKQRLAAGTLGIGTHERPAPLHRVYLLDPSPAGHPVTFEPVSPPDAVVALLVASFQLGIDRPSQLKRSFQNLSAVAAQVPVRRLSRPRGLRHVAHIVEKILEDARG